MLDGVYRITTTSSYDGPLKKESDGLTEIRDGKTERLDAAGCRWTSLFDIIDDTSVKMTSLADPSDARADFMLTRPDGSPTRDPVTYETTLRLSRREDGKIQMSGQIQYGSEIVLLTLRKTGD